MSNMSQKRKFSLPPGFLVQNGQQVLPFAMPMGQQLVPAQCTAGMAPMAGHSPGQVAQYAQHPAMPAMAPLVPVHPADVGAEHPDDTCGESVDSAELRGKKKSDKKKKKKDKKKKKKKTKKGRRKSTGKSSSSSSESSSESSLGSDDQDSEAQDHLHICKSFVRFGFQFRNSYPRKRRWSIVKRILAKRLNPVGHSTLSTMCLDQIIFVGSECSPMACISDLKSVGARTVGALRDMLVKQAQAPDAQARLNSLEPDMSNLNDVAIKLGWQADWTSKYPAEKHEKKKGTKAGPGASKDDFSQATCLAQIQEQLAIMQASQQNTAQSASAAEPAQPAPAAQPCAHQSVTEAQKQLLLAQQKAALEATATAQLPGQQLAEASDGVTTAVETQKLAEKKAELEKLIAEAAQERAKAEAAKTAAEEVGAKQLAEQSAELERQLAQERAKAEAAKAAAEEAQAKQLAEQNAKLERQLAEQKAELEAAKAKSAAAAETVPAEPTEESVPAEPVPTEESLAEAAEETKSAPLKRVIGKQADTDDAKKKAMAEEAKQTAMTEAEIAKAQTAIALDQEKAELKAAKEKGLARAKALFGHAAAKSAAASSS